MINATEKEYSSLKGFIRTKVNSYAIYFIDDIVQDLLIEKDELSECFNSYSSILQRYYLSDVDIDLTKDIQENICSRCKIPKPVMVFRTRKIKNTTFLENICHDCRKECSLDYYYNNRDKCLETRRIYRLNNPEKIRQSRKSYYEKNKEFLNGDAKKKYMKEYRLKNRERIKEYQKAYHFNNSDKIKKYRIDNKDKMSDYQRNYYLMKKDKNEKNIVQKLEINKH